MSNKSGVAEQVISLAKGGGEMKGLGETFSPDLHTGTGNFSVPIALPTGRNGFQPEIGIAYSTGNGNSCFGLGWQLSIPGISRKTAKGIPRYRDASWPQEQDTFLLSGAEDLIPVEQAEDWVRYRPRTEGLFALIRRYKNAAADYWEVKSKDGLVSYYGRSPFADPADSATLYDPANPDRIFSWYLVETRDPFGNRIVYEYERDLIQTEQRHANQLYLKRINYVDYHDPDEREQFLAGVEFAYEADRPDPFSVYTSGFEIRTRRRCKRVATYTYPTPHAPLLVKTYTFDYEPAAWSKTSLLKSVRMSGHDGEQTEALPPLTFAYTDFRPTGHRFEPVSGADFPTQSLAAEDTELIDLFGNGLPDIVQMNGVVRYWKNRGAGQFAAPRIMREAPGGIHLGDPGVQFLDANGEGRVDLLVHGNGRSGYFPTDAEGEWDRSSFRRLNQSLTFDFQDPEVKLVDLSGDGITDVLRSGSRLQAYFNDPSVGWSDLRTAARSDLADFPNVNFSDPRVRLADMTGDGLQDIVFIHGRSVVYWPNLGYNRWGRRIRMDNAPGLPENYDPRRLLLGDIAGDGPHDLIYIDDREVHLWINQQGNGYSEPITIPGTPPVSDLDAVRLVDLYGIGTSGILWSAERRTNGRDHYFFLDLTDRVKPYVLREMNNHLGAITRVQYRPSTYYYRQDEPDRATRWKTTLPFPVQVVACVEVIDEISKNKLVTEYNYRHGYWDGAEREFRGFGRVEQIDTQSFEVYQNTGLHGDQHFQRIEEKFYAPPTKTITWFHQGPVGSGEGDWGVPDYTDEYWSGDGSHLDTFSDLDSFLQSLPSRRQRRDALRTLRGSVLRTELYTLDDRSDIPWTVAESSFSIRQEGESLIDLKGMSRGIFFPMAVAQRTTNWERGADPLTKFSFTGAYDAYGQPRETLAVACPRGWRQASDAFGAGRPFLSTFSRTDLADPAGEAPYLKDRTVRTTTYEVLHRGVQTLNDIRAAITDPERLDPIAQSITYYDGEAFTGLPYGELGAYGAPVRTETLVIDTERLAAAWGTDGELPPYLIPSPTPPNGLAAYPADFRAALAPLAGYNYYDGSDHHAEGYWAESGVRYDFQDATLGRSRGLSVAQRDALGREATVAYDRYHFLPVRSTDPIGLTAFAENDYRLLQPYLSVDPNDNVAMVRFTPLGFVRANYALGKEGVAEGDGLDRQDESALPSSSFEYDWLAWLERRQPVAVRSVAREHHRYEEDVPSDQRDATITSVQFSDGFGRIIQSRAQAEDVLFGDQLLGNELLPEEQGHPDDTRQQTGTVRDQAAPPNVVVSGWQIYDNKGRVVQQYEPFYSTGFAYADLSDRRIGQKIEQYYDPLGRVIKSRNPDGSEQCVVFGIPKQLDTPEDYTPSPWEAYTYDPNDNAERTGHGDRVDESHWNTPASVTVDALGRAVKAVARNGRDAEDEIVTRSTYDIRGNLLTVTDALGRLAFQHFYDLTFDEEDGSREWRSENIDAGVQTTIFNVLGLPVESRDTKNSVVIQAYDDLNRPVRIWARDRADLSITLRQELRYGDTVPLAAADKKLLNLLGQLYLHYDEAGLVQVAGYDFKGNPLGSSRRVLETEKLLDLAGGTDFRHFQVDWAALNAETDLESTAYAMATTYDALDRPTRILYPEDVDGGRKVVQPTYNRAGALESIRLSDPGQGGLDQVGVTHIAYNARGQRTLIAYRNGLMTRYAYDDRRFWLKRLRTEQFTQPSAASFEFTPSGGLKQDIGYEYDLVGNITQIKERGSNLGIAGTALGKDALDRDFRYDPIYRLVSATGRERDANHIDHQRPWLQEIRPTHPSSVTDPATRFYRREYAYDSVGNMLDLRHATPVNNGVGNFTRRFTVNPENNRLLDYRQGDRTHSLVYDVAGNLSREAGARHYHWNHADQLHGFRVQATADSVPSLEARYLYDAGGERVKKIVWHPGGKITTTTYVGGLFEVHTEGTASELSAKTNNTLHLMDDKSRIALIRVGTAFDAQDHGPAVQYQLADHLGNVQVVADEHGSTHSREEHFPYGGSSLNSFAQKRYRFTGKERDEESGLHYHSARYYAPWMMKWISADPAGMVDGVNLYGYVGGRPILYMDDAGNERVVGFIYQIRGYINGKPVRYTGKAMQLKTRLTKKHHWSSLLKDKRTEVFVKPVYAKSRLKKLHRNRALLAVEQQTIDRDWKKANQENAENSRKGKPKVRVLNDGTAAKDPSKWRKKYGARLSSGRWMQIKASGAAIAYKSANIYGLFLSIVEAKRLASSAKREVTYIERGSYILIDENGKFTFRPFRSRFNFLGFIESVPASKTYISGTKKGQTENITPEQFVGYLLEAEAMWGKLNNKDQFEPGLLLRSIPSIKVNLMCSPMGGCRSGGVI